MRQRRASGGRGNPTIDLAAVVPLLKSERRLERRSPIRARVSAVIDPFSDDRPVDGRQRDCLVGLRCPADGSPATRQAERAVASRRLWQPIHHGAVSSASWLAPGIAYSMVGSGSLWDKV